MIHRPAYETRMRVLIELIVPILRDEDRILDVGCGSGEVARAILDSPACPESVQIIGIEHRPRPDAKISVDTYDGTLLPYDDQSFDIVMLLDVLHHADDEHRCSQSPCACRAGW